MSYMFPPTVLGVKTPRSVPLRCTHRVHGELAQEIDESKSLVLSLRGQPTAECRGRCLPGECWLLGEVDVLVYHRYGASSPDDVFTSSQAGSTERRRQDDVHYGEARARDCCCPLMS